MPPMSGGELVSCLTPWRCGCTADQAACPSGAAGDPPRDGDLLPEPVSVRAARRPGPVGQNVADADGRTSKRHGSGSPGSRVAACADGYKHLSACLPRVFLPSDDAPQHLLCLLAGAAPRRPASRPVAHARSARRPAAGQRPAPRRVTAGRARSLIGLPGSPSNCDQPAPGQWCRRAEAGAGEYDIKLFNHRYLCRTSSHRFPRRIKKPRHAEHDGVWATTC